MKNSLNNEEEIYKIRMVCQVEKYRLMYTYLIFTFHHLHSIFFICKTFPISANTFFKFIGSESFTVLLER